MQETINLPAVVTNISLSAGAIQLLTHCIANCPLTEAQRANLNSEFIAAIRAAVEAEAPKEPNRLAKVNGES